jgi:hypothetical protein
VGAAPGSPAPSMRGAAAARAGAGGGGERRAQAGGSDAKARRALLVAMGPPPGRVRGRAITRAQVARAAGRGAGRGTCALPTPLKTTPRPASVALWVLALPSLVAWVRAGGCSVAARKRRDRRRAAPHPLQRVPDRRQLLRTVLAHPDCHGRCG